MAKKAGFLLMATGVALICLSALFMHRMQLDEQALEQTSQTVLTEMALRLNTIPERDNCTTDPYSEKMASLMIDGYEYIGCLSIPALELELPVMSRLDEYRLKLAPCLYQGSVNTGDMIIGAHNYKKHFAGLSKLIPGDTVVFIAMDGNVYFYNVATTEILLPQETDKLTGTAYDLTLFTCTYGGRKRTVVRCDRIIP